MEEQYTHTHTHTHTYTHATVGCDTDKHPNHSYIPHIPAISALSNGLERGQHSSGDRRRTRRWSEGLQKKDWSLINLHREAFRDRIMDRLAPELNKRQANIFGEQQHRVGTLPYIQHDLGPSSRKFTSPPRTVYHNTTLPLVRQDISYLPLPGRAVGCTMVRSQSNKQDCFYISNFRNLAFGEKKGMAGVFGVVKAPGTGKLPFPVCLYLLFICRFLV